MPVFSFCPEWTKYFLYFFIIYAVLNFGLMMSFGSGDDYLDFNVSQHKLSGLSGFWLAFYVFGLIFGYALWIHQNNTIAKSNDD